MKVCSVCQQYYDDSVATCAAEDHGVLTDAGWEDSPLADDYKIDARFESEYPFEIYKAKHLSSDKSVLIRFIKIDPAEKDKVAELKKELQSAVSVDHPNLGRVYEWGRISENELFVVLENVSRQSLYDYLENNSPLKELRAIKIARQLAEGLAALHNCEVVHRAVNPSNICFRKSEDEEDISVKLHNLDFGGIGQEIAVKGANGVDAKIEIFRCFSPEQFTGDKINFKSDIYSLNVLFYEMLCGHSPYEVLSVQGITNYAFDESDVDKLHFDLRALLAYTLRQSLQRRLDLRPPTTDNLVRQLRHLELIATPPAIGLQNTALNYPKAEEPVKIPRPIEPRIENAPVLNSSPLENESFESADDSRVSENIRVTNKELTEDLETEENVIRSLGREFLTESVEEFEGKEPTAEERQPTNLFGGYARAQSSGFNRISLYVAGILALLIFGGILTARILNRQGVETISDSASTSSPANSGVSQKKNESIDAERKQKIEVVPENSETSQLEESQENEISEINEIAVQTRLGSNLPNESAVKTGKNKSLSTDKKKNLELTSEKNSSNSQPAGKKSDQTYVRQRLASTKNTEVGSKKPTAKKTNGVTRPRIVANVKTGN